MLLLHANEVVSSDRLIDELWPGERREEALKALQVAVSRLRKVLEPDRPVGVDSRLILTRPPGYELRLDDERLDAKRFEALVDEGRRVLAAGDAHSACAKLDDALRLWRGERLADLAYESFCQAEVGRLEELHTAALEERIAAELELGPHRARRRAAHARASPASARAAARAADARPLPLRTPGRGPQRLRGRPPRTGGGARHRARSGAARAAPGDP